MDYGGSVADYSAPSPACGGGLGRGPKPVARMKRSEMCDLPAPETKTRIALRSIRATLAA